MVSEMSTVESEIRRGNKAVVSCWYLESNEVSLSKWQGFQELR
jgi:hypothetical protein